MDPNGYIWKMADQLWQIDGLGPGASCWWPTTLTPLSLEDRAQGLGDVGKILMDDRIVKGNISPPNKMGPLNKSTIFFSGHL